MKVLWISHYMDKPEAHLLLGLHTLGISLHLICHPDSPFQSEVVERGIPVEQMVLKGKIDLCAIQKIRKKIFADHIQIIHTFSNSALSNAMCASWKTGAKVVAYRGTVGNLSKLNPISWMTYLHPYLNRIICVSEAVKDSLYGLGIPEKKLVKIYKGHVLAWYPKSDADIFEEFHIPRNAFVVACVANMRPLKGIDTILESAQYFSGNTPIHFLLIGEVRDKHLHSLAEKSGRKNIFHFTGHRPDATKLLGACHASIMVSIRREGFPKSVIESMAQGVPVIVSDVGGLPEMIRDGLDGFVIPASNSKALAEKIEFLARNSERCQEMGNSGKIRVQNFFTIQRTIQETHEVYEKLMCL